MKGIVIADKFRHFNYYETLSRIVPSLETSEPGRIKASETPSLTTIISMTTEPRKYE